MNAKIVIASTLKPVIDPRAYEKFAKSLAGTGKYAVHILGPQPGSTTEAPGIFLHPIGKQVKGSWQRLLVPWRLLWQTLRLRPQLLLITTHELIWMAVFYKLITCCTLVYDIQENYYFNLRYQSNYRPFIKRLLAFYIRAKEQLTAHFFNHFILAEQCYADELPFIGTKFTVIENKFKPSQPPPARQPQEKITLLLSGTISKEYGAFEAIDFIRQLPAASCQLTMIGHCPNRATYRQLQAAAVRHENINFMVADEHVPQTLIYDQIGDKTIGLLPYQDNKSTRNKIPTKLYEYIGLGIPVLIPPNPRWQEIVKKYQAGEVVDFQQPPDIARLSRFFTGNKSTQQADLKDIMWTTEENKLLALIERLI